MGYEQPPKPGAFGDGRLYEVSMGLLIDPLIQMRRRPLPKELLVRLARHRYPAGGPGEPKCFQVFDPAVIGVCPQPENGGGDPCARCDVTEGTGFQRSERSHCPYCRETPKCLDRELVGSLDRPTRDQP
jgi:hypothetical protein